MIPVESVIYLDRVPSDRQKKYNYRPTYTLPIDVLEATPSIRSSGLSEPIVCPLCGSDNRGCTVQVAMLFNGYLKAPVSLR